MNNIVTAKLEDAADTTKRLATDAGEMIVDFAGDAVEQSVKRFDKALRFATKIVKKHPIAAVGIGLAVGIGIGYVVAFGIHRD